MFLAADSSLPALSSLECSGFARAGSCLGVLGWGCSGMLDLVALKRRYHGGDMGRPTKEYQAFTSLMDRLLAVPKTEVDRRQAEYRKVAAKNPRKRGPKPKA